MKGAFVWPSSIIAMRVKVLAYPPEPSAKIAQQPGTQGLDGPLNIAFHSKLLRFSYTKGLRPFVQTLWQLRYLRKSFKRAAGAFGRQSGRVWSFHAWNTWQQWCLGECGCSFDRKSWAYLGKGLAGSGMLGRWRAECTGAGGLPFIGRNHVSA